MPLIFISYRRRDCSFVAAVVCERLERRFGTDSCFLDVDDIPLGVEFRQCIEEAIKNCKLLLVLIGDRWIHAEDGSNRLLDPEDCVRFEMETAVAHRIPVVPVLAGTRIMPRREDLPESLRFILRQQAAEIQGGRYFFRCLEEVESGIAHLLGTGVPSRGDDIGIPVSAPDHVIALGAIEDRLKRLRQARIAQRTMLVQAAAGGSAMLTWRTSSDATRWITDPGAAVALLERLDSDEVSLTFLENIVDSVFEGNPPNQSLQQTGSA